MLLCVDSLAKSYKQPLFHDIGFTLNAGAGLGIAGNNGSGKTTLLHILTSLVQPDAGTVTLNARIGYVPQKDGLPDNLSCLDVLKLYSRLAGMTAREEKEKIAACVEFCDINDFLKKRLGLCSSGMRQRVSIAVAMLTTPELILLDEVFTALDEASRDAIKLVLMGFKERGVGIIMVSHSRGDFDGLCERVLRLPAGTVEPV